MADGVVTTIHPNAITDVSDDGMFSDKRMELIRRQCANGAPEDLFAAMIEIARSRGLDPLAKQISLIKFGGTWQITTTIDGYRAIAESSGTYAGSDAPVFVMGNQKTTLGKAAPDSATVTVWKLLGGTRYPFGATVYWEEYAAQGQWPKIPRTMLAKVAESHALRKAFPKVLSGVYTADEMDQAGSIEVSARVVNQHTGEIDYPTSGTNPPKTEEDREKQAFWFPENAAWDRASKRLHAAANDCGVDHDVLHKWAVGIGKDGIKDVDAQTLNNLAENFQKRPEYTLERMAKYMEQPEPDPIEAEHHPVTTGAPTPEEMDAAIESATPTSLPLDTPDADRFRQ